ncbi:FHA domain-containing protein At4g14490 [Linum perenne]
MEETSLRLSILKGPREGQTFEFHPGSSVRIGRVVRGNTLAIKDAGISTKHLLINSESGKWTLQDLDSSNGTTLNSSLLPPLQPLDLRHGDQIKLGELTSMAVHLVSVIQNLEPIAVAAADNVRKRRGRPPKPRVPAPPVVGRMTRSKHKETESLESGIQLEKKRQPTRRMQVKEEEVSFVEEAQQEQGGDVVSSEDNNERPSEAVVGEEPEMTQKSKLKSNSDKQGHAPATTNVHDDSREQVVEEEKEDLEKMTAKQWFDYMEVHLRKQNMEATEKIIDEMRKKAERVREYVAEQKRNKGIS